MTQSTGQSRGSQKHKRFIQDSANSYIVESFRNVAASAPVSPTDGEGYIVSSATSLHASWGAISGLADNDIIRYRASRNEWRIVHKAIAANQGSQAYTKNDDKLYSLNVGATWTLIPGNIDAEKIQGVNVSTASPSNGQALIYNSSNSRYEPAAAIVVPQFETLYRSPVTSQAPVVFTTRTVETNTSCLSYSAGTWTATRRCIVTMHWGGISGGSPHAGDDSRIYFNGVIIAQSNASNGHPSSCSIERVLEIGDTCYYGISNPNAQHHYGSIKATPIT